MILLFFLNDAADDSFIEIRVFSFFLSSLNKADQIFSPPYGALLYQSCKYSLVFRYG